MHYTVHGASAAPEAEPVKLETKDPAPDIAVMGPAVAPAQSVRFDARILHSLRRIIHGFDLYSKQLLATSHMTAPQLVCLLAVAEAGPLTGAAIGRRVYLSASTIVGILDRLEEKGLITRTRANDDRRVVLVSATAQGMLIAKQSPSPLQQTLTRRLAALPDLEQATIALSLERLVELMDVQSDAAAPPRAHADGTPAP